MDLPFAAGFWATACRALKPKRQAPEDERAFLRHASDVTASLSAIVLFTVLFAACV
ncbi:MAG: hypothetical protein KF819_22035 [Labilithrix sp.]|nr:hypothetical protein [Labilithrix sp.]